MHVYCTMYTGENFSVVAAECAYALVACNSALIRWVLHSCERYGQQRHCKDDLRVDGRTSALLGRTNVSNDGRSGWSRSQ